MQASKVTVARFKGTAFRGYGRYLDNDLSPKEREDLLSRMRPETRRLFDPKELLITGMYPIEIHHDFLEAFRATFPLDTNARLELVGRRVAEIDLRGIYRIFIKVTSVELTLKALVKVWNSYFDTGTATYSHADHGGHIDITDPAHHPLHDPIVAGYVAFAVELAGGQDVSVRLLPREGQTARFDVRWR